MMTADETRELILKGETLTVEFKSDRGPLSDGDLISAVVCLTNLQGGKLLIGVENDGTITGLHEQHLKSTPNLLAAFIINQTVPPTQIEVDFVGLSEGVVAVVSVPRTSTIVSTTDGRAVIRYQDSHGRPGCRPLYPHEISSWHMDRQQRDVTDMVIRGLSWDAFDPLEFARLRRLIEAV